MLHNSLVPCCRTIQKGKKTPEMRQEDGAIVHGGCRGEGVKLCIDIYAKMLVV